MLDWVGVYYCDTDASEGINVVVCVSWVARDLLLLISLQTMHQKVVLAVLLAAGLLCLSLAPVAQAQDLTEDDQADDVDLEDVLDMAEDEELEGDVQDEAPPPPTIPAAPKVRRRQLNGQFLTITHMCKCFYFILFVYKRKR